MGAVKHAVRVVEGGGYVLPVRRQPPLVVGYENFRLDRQGQLLSPKTLIYYDETVLPFLRWLEAEGVRRFDEVDVSRVRSYRAHLATKLGKWSRPLAPKTILESHRAVLCFLRWARREGYAVDPRILELQAPRVPDKEPTVYHIAQVRKILAACNSTRVPITPKLAAAIKRYEARHRRDTDLPQLLINVAGRPYRGPGIKSMMDRLANRTGFRVHAHAFQHTFATVAAKMGWNFEHLRAAMGHSDYGMLQRYVRLATDRDLGSRADWLELIASNPATEWS
jgi:site-specific recombinase XerD